MSRLILSFVMFSSVLFLSACGQPPQPLAATETDVSQSYGYHADPPAYQEPPPPTTERAHEVYSAAPASSPISESTAPQAPLGASTANAMNQNAPDQHEVVQGFPEGHPLYQPSQAADESQVPSSSESDGTQSVSNSEQDTGAALDLPSDHSADAYPDMNHDN